MRQAVTIISGQNYVNLGYYAQEDGISISTEKRNEKTVTTMDGTLHKFAQVKRIIVVNLLDLYDEDFRGITQYIPTDPSLTVYVSYMDASMSTSTSFSGYFYVEMSYTAKKVINSQDNSTNSKTIITGCTITLTEK